MTIIFSKPKEFDPADVKNANIDIDENWYAKDVNFINKETKDNTDMYKYELTLVFKKTNEESTRKSLILNRYTQPNNYHHNNDMIIKKVGEERDWYAQRIYSQINTKNIVLLLRTSVKDRQFAGVMFDMRRITKKDAKKRFGNIFQETRPRFY